jgi:hypothetical protein
MKIPGGTFDKELHLYYDDRGCWVPSLTQTIKLAGYTDYSRVSPDVLAKAAVRGTKVHELVEFDNKTGEVPDDLIEDGFEGYYAAYKRFKQDVGFTVEKEWCEKSLIHVVDGMKFGLTNDMVGAVFGDRSVIDVKSIETKYGSWAVQTAAESMAVNGSSHCGHMRRFSLQLFKTGKYKLNEYQDHAGDADAFKAALKTVWWRINEGHNLLEMIQQGG